ncbi:hypothetical protein [Flavobacterium sp. 3HN19-14]|uniref:hypothetical protein n=1 Tax=Flavobacterium sp. 3HN19-14 TaxID=3448133 RepID=UPI003EE18126
MDVKDEYELVVSEGKRAIWQIIFAAMFFTVTCYCIYSIALMYYTIGMCVYTGQLLADYIELIALSLSAGISFSVVKTVLIDVDKDILISRFFVLTVFTRY